MKKIIVIALTIILSMGLLASCNNIDDEIIEVNIIMPDGAPSLAFAKLLAEDLAPEGYKINFEIAIPSAGLQAPTIVGSKLSNKTADIAIVPNNVAANLYNNGLDIKMVANSIWGNIFMISKGDIIEDANDLKGKVVYNISENGSPDLVFKYILQENDIEYTTDYELDNDIALPVDNKVVLAYSTPQEVIINIKQGKIEYGILGEPAITNALNAIGEEAKVVLDMQEEWQEITGFDYSYAQAGLVAQSSFIAEHPDFIEELITMMQSSDNWLKETNSENEPVNIDEAKQVYDDYHSSALLNISLDTITRSNINTVSLSVAKDSVVQYLQVIYDFNPNAVGGQMPDEDFYYIIGD